MQLALTKLADFTRDNIIRRGVAVEAGYVNNPADKGGETKCGITATTAAEHKVDLIKLFKWNGQMKDLTEEMAIWIYRTAWWDRLRLDDILKIHPFIADRLFDFGINAGRGAAGTNIQRILNVMNRMQQDYKDIKPDGAIGDGTVDALKAYVAKRGQVGILNMIQLLIDLQGAYYIQVAEKRELNETFMSGWTTRVREANELYQRIFQAN